MMLCVIIIIIIGRPEVIISLYIAATNDDFNAYFAVYARTLIINACRIQLDLILNIICILHENNY